MRATWAIVGVAMLSLGGCSWMHHGRKAGCREPGPGGNAENREPLKVPAGLDSPDTRNAIKIPPLTEPERPRTASEPCLSQPPKFKS